MHKPLTANDLAEVYEIDLVITSTCNLSGTCTPCYLTQEFLGSRQRMSLDLVRAVVAWAGRRKPGLPPITFNLLGGEPTLHPHFLDIVQIIAAAGHQVTMVSNGSRALLAQLAKPLTLPDMQHLTLGQSDLLSYVALSIDGPTARVHDRLRGPGSFAGVMTAAAALRRYGIPFGVNWTAQYQTLRFDYDMVDLALQLGARRLNIHGMSLQGTARQRARTQELIPPAQRRLWTHMNARKLEEYRRPGGPRLVIDCEASLDDQVYTKPRLDTDLVIDPTLCNVRRPTGLTVYPNGDTISCPLFAETPYLGGYVWRDNTFYRRDHPNDEIAVAHAAGDCRGCPLYKGQPIDGYIRLCVLTRTDFMPDRVRRQHASH